jgi:hypothetical protein
LFNHKVAQRESLSNTKEEWESVKFFCRQKYKTKLKELNLPQYSFRISGKEGSQMILDPIRRKFVKFTPEEQVRQNFIQYLINEGGYPPGLMGIEVMFSLNKLKRRIDILIHNRAGEPVMIVECKAPEITIDDTVFEQIATYNMKFKVPYLVVTNGIHHYACKIDHENMKFDYLLVIPLYQDLLE